MASVVYSDPPLGPEAAELGELLRSARTAPPRPLKQADLAAKVGTSTTTVSLLERGRRAVSPEMLDRIVTEVGADATAAFRLAGMLPPAAVTQVLGAEVGHALAGGSLVPEARRLLRRVHLGKLASELTDDVVAPPVPIADLLFRRLSIDTREADGVDWARFDDMVWNIRRGLSPPNCNFG